jgi:hypothetical protein
VEIVQTKTVRQVFQRDLGRAKTSKKADEVYRVAVWGLKKGLLNDFYEAVDLVLTLDPDHADAKRVKALKAAMEMPIGDSSVQEQELKKRVPLSKMRIEHSKHFVLLTDVPQTPPEGQKLPRAQQRLNLLEQVYESFLLTFFAQGVELEIPKERLKVVLFQNYQDYLNLATKLDPELKSASGFYEPDINNSYFYDFSTDDDFKYLQELLTLVKKDAADAVRRKTDDAAELRRTSEALQLVVNVDRENLDVTVVSHECTHQMAANTGLFPRYVQVPDWAHEGLATYFECPSDGAWGGIGAVNAMRIGLYRDFSHDAEHCNVDFVVGDQIFKYAASHGAILAGYSTAWAFTHFMMETRFKDFITYYRMIGELPPEAMLSPEILTKIFDKAMGTERSAIDLEWKSYMQGLKTDKELILGEDDDIR